VVRLRKNKEGMGVRGKGEIGKRKILRAGKMFWLWKGKTGVEDKKIGVRGDV